MKQFNKLMGLMLVSLLLTSCLTKESGQKSGVIVKVAKQGLWWGTYEGELIRGGLDNANGVNGRHFTFTLGQFKSRLVQDAIDALKANQHVIAEYHCEQFVAPWRGGNSCFVDRIIKNG